MQNKVLSTSFSRAPLLTDAAEPVGVCAVGQVPAGGPEAVPGVGLGGQRGAPLLHGQRARGGGHVHEHGARSLPAGQRRCCTRDPSVILELSNSTLNQAHLGRLLPRLCHCPLSPVTSFPNQTPSIAEKQGIRQHRKRRIHG